MMKIFLILSLFFATVTTTTARKSRGLFSGPFFASATTKPLVNNTNNHYNVIAKKDRLLQSFTCNYDDVTEGRCSLQQYCESNYVNTDDTFSPNITFACQGNIDGAWTFAGESPHDHVECYYENGRNYHIHDPNRPANDEGLKYCFATSGFAVISFAQQVALEVYTVGKFTRPMQAQIKGWFPVSLCKDGEQSDFEFAGASYCSDVCPTRLEVDHEPCDLFCEVCEGDWSAFECANFEPPIEETCDVDGISFEEQVAAMLSSANRNLYYFGGTTILSTLVTVWMGF